MAMGAPDPGTCLYGAGYLSDLLEAFSAEVEGVRAADDIEYIHRMRVASRRIRAALPLFKDCFSGKEYRFWNKEVRAITRALGAARDADVQIAFLRSVVGTIGERERPSMRPIFLLMGEDTGFEPAPLVPVPKRETAHKTLKKRIYLVFARIKDSIMHNGANRPQDITVAADPSPRYLLPGLECLLLRLQQRRAGLQPAVIAGIDRLERTGVVEAMEDALAGYLEREECRNTDVRSHAAYVRAFSHISRQIDEVFRFEPFVAMPDRTVEHHAMRIAVKHLRYTMEAFQGLYGDGLKEPLKKVMHLQDVLGELHDCDVWLGFLPEFLDAERERQREYFGHLDFFRLVEPGIHHLIDDRARQRRELHALLVRTWAEQKEERLWERLREAISTPLPGREQGAPTMVALIGDVHANLPALAAVLNDAWARGATLVLNAGDSVGGGPAPNEVLQMLAAENVISVVGNYDRDVLGARRIRKTSENRKRRKALRRARRSLSRKSRRYLRTLPEKVRLRLFGKRILLTHGSPASNTEYISENTASQRLKDLAAAADADVIVTGHSHRPFAAEVGGVWFVNTGSVGKPDDGDSRACYALLRPDPFTIEHISVAYGETPQEGAEMQGEGGEPDTIKTHNSSEPTPQQSDRTAGVQQVDVERQR